MMLQLLKAIYSTVILPPISILLILFIYAFWLVRRDRLAGRWLLFILCIFYLLSTGFVGYGLLGALESRYTPPLIISGDVIVLLGGGATKDTPNMSWQGHPSGAAANRLLTAAHLYYRLKVPVIISGGQVGEADGNEAVIYSNILQGVGVPLEKIIIEEKSLNTEQNAYFSSILIKQYGFQRPILLTSAFHMERAIKEFANQGVQAEAYPTDYRMNINNALSWRQFVPSMNALNATNMALKEWAGIMVLKCK